MALTVRPDDEVYQFDTVWLGPDEYTLPIQARYVAWGTWLACFLVAAVVLIPLGGSGPAGVLGSLIWSLGLSVVLSRAVMLVVDHERPLRSLPALFSAEARAALAARRRGERSLLVRPGKIRVRETPAKVLAMRERERTRAVAKAARRHRPSTEPAVVEPEVVAAEEPAWTPDVPLDEWYAEPAPAWSVPTDEDYPVAPVPAWGMPAGEHERYVVTPAPVEPEVHEFVRAPDPAPAAPRHAAPEPVRAAAPARAAAQSRPAVQTPTRPAQGQGPARPVARPDGAGPFRADPHEPEVAYRGPVTVSPDEGKHARPATKDADPHAALEARILLPARKDR
jgi:hypothetical protein